MGSRGLRLGVVAAARGAASPGLGLPWSGRHSITAAGYLSLRAGLPAHTSPGLTFLRTAALMPITAPSPTVTPLATTAPCQMVAALQMRAPPPTWAWPAMSTCLLYTSDAADEEDSV